MAVRKLKNSWWVDFMFKYTRYRKRSPDNSRAGAEAYEAALRQKLAHGESIDNPMKELPQEPTFEEFAWKWFEEYAVPNNKFTELRAKKSALRSSLIPFFKKIPIKRITAHDIERFKAHCLKEGSSRKTINNHLAVLSKCLGTAYDWLKFAGAPPKIMWLKCPPPRTDHFTPEECARLLSCADGTVREMILIALRTGMRQGEIKGLQWSSINWQNRTITVLYSLCNYTKQLASPKSNRARTIPLDGAVYDKLLKRKQDNGYVFMTSDGKPFTGQRMLRALRDVRCRAGLRHLGWHTLRHTFASQLAIRGVPLHFVQMLLGHSSITTTMRYAHVAPSALRAAIDMLNPEPAADANFRQPVVNWWLDAMDKEMSTTKELPPNARFLAFES